MTGSFRILLLSCVLFLWLPAAAPAWCDGPVPVMAWYCPAPVAYYNPCPYFVPLVALPAVAVVPLPAERAGAAAGEARPAPAPPSGGPANPTAPPRKAIPGVTETRPYYDAYTVAPRSSDKPAGDLCWVGFWNLSSRDMTLKLGERTHTLPRGKSIKLEVGRQFAWRIEDREAQNESVSANTSGLEIVIRR